VASEGTASEDKRETIVQGWLDENLSSEEATGSGVGTGSAESLASDPAQASGELPPEGSLPAAAQPAGAAVLSPHSEAAVPGGQSAADQMLSQPEHVGPPAAAEEQQQQTHTEVAKQQDNSCPATATVVVTGSSGLHVVHV
jgi:hypothetical protein